MGDDGPAFQTPHEEVATDMNQSPPPDGVGPATWPNEWKTTTPSKLFDEEVKPRRLPPYPARQPQRQSMSPAAHLWLAGLPPHFQPLATARRHPHIVNHLSGMWGHQTELNSYFQELLLSRRPEREGFSFDVLGELVDLQSYCENKAG